MALLIPASLCYANERHETCSKQGVPTQLHNIFLSSTAEITGEAEKAASNSQQSALLGYQR